MGRKRRKETADKKKKKITVDVISREHAGKTTKLYAIMDRLVKKFHGHLAEARIAIGWRYEKKSDADGRLWLGSLKKASDLDRKLHDYDFVMLLNHEFCNQAATDEQIEALIDHELCHGAVAIDSDGEPKIDDNDRTVYRIRKHDVEEFREIISRHGAWKQDLEGFFAAWKEANSRPLFNQENKAGKKRGAKFSEPAQAAAGKSAGKSPDKSAATNGYAGAWTEHPIAALALSKKALELLEAEKLTTIGKVADFDNGEGGLEGLKGLGPKGAEIIRDRLKDYQVRYEDFAPAGSR